MTNAGRGLGWALTRVDAAGGRREDFAEGDFCPGDVLGGQWLEVGPYEATKQGRANIIRVSL